MAIGYGEEDDTAVEEDNGNRVCTTGNVFYLIHQFRAVNTTNRDSIKAKINLRSSLAPIDSTVYLQVWNVADGEWQTLTSNNTAGADADFDLENTIDSDQSDYYDDDYEIALRVYQFNV